LVVRACLTGSQSPLHLVEAQAVQGGQVKATATGKFLETPDALRILEQP